jgi:hypothetical protein
MLIFTVPFKFDTNPGSLGARSWPWTFGMKGGIKVKVDVLMVL